MRNYKAMQPGAAGPGAELVQLALQRAGYDIVPGGIYDSQTAAALADFKKCAGIAQDSDIVDCRTWQTLEPFLTGYRVVTAGIGDTVQKLADTYGIDLKTIQTANPGLDGAEPEPGRTVIIPLAFDVVPQNVRFTSEVLSLCVEGLLARYPFLEAGSIGTSVLGRTLHLLKIGTGAHRVLYNAAHHANEWITSPVLMLFLEKYAAACACGGKIIDIDALSLYSETTLNLVPMVNPDGVDLVTGLLDSDVFYENAAVLSRTNPAVSFPSGWKANISGVDLNLQYPAGWENAAAVKASQGITEPGPRDYPGPAPLSEPESRALYQLTKSQDFDLTLSYHTQGRVIYWKYLDFEPKNSYKAALKFAARSGYDVEETPISSGYAGYKDWFISEYNKPGYTIEAGEGTSPLPMSQFARIFEDNVGILTLGLCPPEYM